MNSKIENSKTTKQSSRRSFVKNLGKCCAALALSGGIINAAKADNSKYYKVEFESALVGTIQDGVAKDYSPVTGEERRAIPSACWQCVARDGIIGYVEDGRITHLEGNPKLLRTNGKLCARGQGGVGQVYDPDRLLFPMKRVSGTERGAGSWQRLTWTEALDELESQLSTVRSSAPEKLMFHYGRMKASSSKIIKDYFLYGFGSKTYAGHTSICEAAKWTAQELVWGSHYEINDVENTNLILNFGVNPLEAHTNHLPLAQRIVTAITDNSVPMYTFDVRLSNTAAKSTEWVPILPGTDLAVILSMAYHIIENDLMPQEGKDFINNWTNIDSTGYTDKVAALKAFLEDPGTYLSTFKSSDSNVPAYWATSDQPTGGYTPEWAETVSGVSATKIKEIAELYASKSPGSTIISYRGAVMHFNGVNTERAIMMLQGMGGNIETKGGRVHHVSTSWDYSSTFPKPSSSGLPSLSLQNDSAYVKTTHHASHQVLSQIKAAAAADRPDIYMVYCYSPAYANGDIQENIDILKSETYIPYLVVIDTSYTETAMYADLLLPDATYLERWDWEDMYSMNLIPEYYIRQPLINPLGQARDFKNVCIELARRLSTGSSDELEKTAAIGNAEDYVKAACNDTTTVNDAAIAAGYTSGFEFMKEVGAYYDPTATPTYESHLEEVSLTITDPASISDTDTTKYVWKDSEGICWEGTKADYNTGYRDVSSAYSNYKGQDVNGTIYKGFKPDKINKSGLFELDAYELKKDHFPGMPMWMPIPEHQNLASNELFLITYKLANQTHSRTQNCKYLTELSHDNPALINSTTATSLGLSDGDQVTLALAKTMYNDLTIDDTKKVGVTATNITVTIKVIEGIVPGVIAISHHLGHWQYGRYASGNTNPFASSDSDQENHISADPDSSLKWWSKYGYRPNWIIPNAGDPICGAIRVQDTVVTVTKA